MTSAHTLYVTEQDMDRLTGLIDAYRASGMAHPNVLALDEELGHADVVPQAAIPPGVVTMNSRVAFEDEVTGERREVTLVYPKDAEVDSGKISVFAPVGSALLGLSVGQSIDWSMPDGRVRRLRIASVLYQPEAAGDLHL